MLDELIGAALLTGAHGMQEADGVAIVPDPLVRLDGSAVTDASDWPARRAEIAALFAEHMYGDLPPAPERMDFVVTEEGPALDDQAWRRQITIQLHEGKSSTELSLLLYLPASRSGPVPAFVGLNFYGNHSVTDDPAVPLCDAWIPGRAKGVVDNRATEASRGNSTGRWSVTQTLARGCAVATLYHGALDPDSPDRKEGVREFLERAHGRKHGQRDDPSETDGADATATERDPTDNWSTIGVWAWGLHRALDALQNDPDVRGDQVVVMGHSRNGKTALLAGATDERFAGTISNQSGCGGAALSRRRVGETVRKINERFPHWFCARFHEYNDREDALPLDQHLLIAMCAPRPVLVCSAVEDRWADPEGEFLALRGADPVYRLLGVEGLGVTEFPAPNQRVGGRLQYHIRPGKHAVGPADWNVFADFADQVLARGTE